LKVTADGLFLALQAHQQHITVKCLHFCISSTSPWESRNICFHPAGSPRNMCVCTLHIILIPMQLSSINSYHEQQQHIRSYTVRLLKYNCNKHNKDRQLIKYPPSCSYNSYISSNIRLCQQAAETINKTALKAESYNYCTIHKHLHFARILRYMW